MSLSFSHPISTVQENPKFEFKEDTLIFKTKWVPGFYKSNISQIQFGYRDSTHIYEDPNNPGTFISSTVLKKIKLKENTTYHLFIPPGTFTDIFGLTNDTIKIDFKTREEKFYGILKLKVNIPETKGNYIVQLLDEKENVVRENFIKKSETINYDYLYPQKYKLKIIVDENNNNKWDTGNFLQKIKAEKVIYNSEPITIRSNWDLDLDWIVGGK
jgi:hypothetical protein